MTFSIGVDVGGTKILAGLVDDSGAIITTARRESPRNDANKALAVVAEVVAELSA
ncbi:MAG: ROK family protein, partial [Candidatus Nanopelagicales bacterium]